MNAEFQSNNKLVGRRVMEFAESCSLLAEGQHRSRKHHQAFLCHLNKILLVDYFRLR